MHDLNLRNNITHIRSSKDVFLSICVFTNDETLMIHRWDYQTGSRKHTCYIYWQICTQYQQWLLLLKMYITYLIATNQSILISHLGTHIKVSNVSCMDNILFRKHLLEFHANIMRSKSCVNVFQQSQRWFTIRYRRVDLIIEYRITIGS